MCLRAPDHPPALFGSRSLLFRAVIGMANGQLPNESGEIGDLMAVLNIAAESIPGCHAGLGELDVHGGDNSLTILVGNSELLTEPLHDDLEGSAFAEVGESAALRGLELTKGLLASAHHQPFAAQVTDVNTLSSGMINLLRRSLGEHVECRLALGAAMTSWSQ